MGRRPEPETFDVDPPREPIRPDEGYRVGARISAGDAGRTRLAGAIAIGVVLAGIAFAAIGPLLPALPELPIAPVPSRSTATALPEMAILRAPAPTRLLPVYAGGLRWLDPAGGAMSGDPYTAPRTGLFVDADGHGLCVCLEVPWSQDELVTRVTIRRYSDGGQEVARVAIDELHSVARVFGDPITVEAAIAPDGRRLWIVHTVRVAGAWEIGLDRVDLATLTVEASLALEPIPVPASGTNEVLGPTPAGWVTHGKSAVRASLRVSPDGTRLAVIESVSSDPGVDPRLPKFQEARLVLPANLDPGVGPEVAVPAHDATADQCFSDLSAWATDRHFVTICSRPEGDGVQPFVRIEDPDDIVREVTVGPPVGTADTEWLLDSERGVIYRWSRLAHVFSRLQVATRSGATAAIDASRVGTGDLARWPAPVSATPPWGPLAGTELGARPSVMVGSADGSLIYALGHRSVADSIRDDRIASTGIWVFDAANASLVAHWNPAALYSYVGFAPGWDQLVTVAFPGVDAEGQPADWKTSLRFHDPRSGMVVEVLGDVEESSGFVPLLFVPNVPRGIAGF